MKVYFRMEVQVRNILDPPARLRPRQRPERGLRGLRQDRCMDTGLQHHVMTLRGGGWGGAGIRPSSVCIFLGSLCLPYSLISSSLSLFLASSLHNLSLSPSSPIPLNDDIRKRCRKLWLNISRTCTSIRKYTFNDHSVFFLSGIISSRHDLF